MLEYLKCGDNIKKLWWIIMLVKGIRNNRSGGKLICVAF
jgi:hypothetical protein